MRHYKIPKSRRHKKLKSVDPCFQRESEANDIFKEIKNRKKAAKERKRVEDLSEQQVSRKMTELMAWKETERNKLRQRKKKQKQQHGVSLRIHDNNEDMTGQTRALKPLPDVVEQGAYETDEQFIRRLERLSSVALAEAVVEDKFDLDFCEKMNTDGDKSTEDKPVSKRKAKKNLRKKLKKQKEQFKKKEKEGDFQHVKDHIEFGEVVEAPPDLSKFKAKLNKKVIKSVF